MSLVKYRKNQISPFFSKLSPNNIKAAIQIGKEMARYSRNYSKKRKSQTNGYKKNKKPRIGSNRAEGGVTTQNDSRTLYIKRRRVNRKRLYYKRLGKKIKRSTAVTHTLLPNPTVQHDDIFVEYNKRQKWACFAFLDKTDIDMIYNHALSNSIETDVNVTKSYSYDGANNKWFGINPFIKHCEWEINVIGTELLEAYTPWIIDVYWGKVIKDISSISADKGFDTWDELLNSDVQGLASATNIYDTGDPVGTNVTSYTTNANISPFAHKQITRHIRFYKKRQYTVTQGQVFTINGMFNVNKSIGRYPDQDILGKKNATEVIIFQVRDARYNIGYEAADKGIITSMTRTWRYQQDIVQAPTYSRDLTTYAP